MAFSYKRAITIDYTKCGSADSSNFPLYFAGHSSLATVANGGRAQNASGYDIGFYADSSLTTKLAWETVSWSASTGLGEWHIQVPTLSASVNSVIYCAVGNPAIATDQSAATAVWDSNFKTVYHFGTASTVSGSDSTSNANTATLYNVSSAAGLVGGAGSFNGSTSSYGISSDSGFPSGSAARTVSAWLNRTTYSETSSYTDILAAYGSGSVDGACGLATSSSSGSTPNGTNAIFFGYGDDVSSAGATSAGAWHQLTGVFSAGTGYLYLDGVLLTSASKPSWNTVLREFNIGRNVYSGYAQHLFGLLDEVRVSSIARSASWIKAEYNNQNSPSTFYGIGSEVAVATPAKSGFFRLMM